MWWSLLQTAERPDTRLVLVVDHDDPSLADYLAIPAGRVRRFGWSPDELWVVVLPEGETGNLVKATNSAARRFWDQTDILGHVGDDHRFRTPGWDRMVQDALVTPGIAYGDDLFQGEKLVSGGCFISTSIVRALGWYALPTCRHLFIDNAWGDLGRGLGALRWLPEMVIEHVHPAAGKGEWDDMYRAYNSGEMFAHDRAAYETWVRDSMASDLARALR